MARKPRIEYEGAAYHVMSRGNRGADIFVDERDRQIFLDTLDEVCGRMAWEIHSFVLMSNHYHSLLVTPRANLVEGMKWFQGAFTQRINARHRWRGHLFQGRYRAQNVDPESSEGYFRTVANYIHLNPARAGMIGPAKGTRWKALAEYPWSSLPLYLGSKSRRPEWLVVDNVFGELGLRDDSRGRRKYAMFLDQVSNGEAGSPEEDEQVKSGWYLGAQAFRDCLVDQLEAVASKRKRDSVSGAGVREVDEREAGRLLSEGMRLLKLKSDQLNGLAKNDSRKQALAWLIRMQTSVRNAWVCDQLRMGHVANVSRGVKRMREKGDNEVRVLRKNLSSISICKD